MPCLKCGRGLHSLCSGEGCDKCHPVEAKVTTISYEAEDEPDDVEVNGDFATGKLDSALKDQQSTGRKRAAKLYPLDKNAPCEWQNLDKAGGGQVPIKGCTTGTQQARHHGPDYNTLNNDPGNVHRICHTCHNTWHAANDLFKDSAYLLAYGHKPSREALSATAKALRSGVN